VFIVGHVADYATASGRHEGKHHAPGLPGELFGDQALHVVQDELAG
jgi:hypothetical protein